MKEQDALKRILEISYAGHPDGREARLEMITRIAQAALREADCDCIASGNPGKPKQHGADPHAKSCAVYMKRS